MGRFLTLLLLPILAWAGSVDIAWDDPGWSSPVEVEIQSSLDGHAWAPAGCQPIGTLGIVSVDAAPPVQFRARALEPGAGFEGSCDAANATRVSGWSNAAIALVPYGSVDVTIPIYQSISWGIKPPHGQAQLDPSDSINDGLELWIPFLEDAGPTLSGLVNNHLGTLNNQSPASAWAPGPNGPAMDLNGTDGFISIPSAAGIDTIPVGALCFRVYFDTLATEKVFFGKRTGSFPNYQGWVVWHLAGQANIRFLMQRSTSGLKIHANDNKLQAATWHHICITWDINATTADQKQYVDGVEVSSYDPATQVGSGSQVSDAGNRITIGKVDSDSGADYAPVRFDGLRIYRGRQLRADEAKRLAEDPGAGFLPPRNYFFVPEAAGTITPSQGLLLFNGRAPAFSADRIIQPDQGLFALNGRAPAFNVDARIIQPNQGLFALNGGAVDSDARTLIQVDQGLFALNGRAPAFNVDARLLQPNQGLLLLNSGEPVVNADERLILPDQGLLLFKGYVPDFTTAAGVTLQVDQGLLLLNGRAVAFNVDERLLQPDQGLLLFGGNAPAFVTQRNLAVDRGLLLFKGDAPAFTRVRGLFVDRGVLSFIGGAPAFARTTRITVERGLLLLNGQPIGSFLGGVTVVEPAAGQLLFQGGSIGGSAMIWTETDEVSGTWSAVQTAAGTWILIRGRDA